MSVIDFKEAIRARLSQMCDEHYAMQEALMSVPQSQVAEHCRRMTEHAEEVSKLASRLYEGESVQDVQTVSDDGPDEAA